MGQQLKQALIDAGIVSRKEIAREKVMEKQQSKRKDIREDQLRIICETCGKSAPDVERYGHRNRAIAGKEWLCLPCADEHSIADDCRMTAQSSQAKSGLFIRRYGRTKKF